MTNEFELADVMGPKLIYDKQDLLAPLLPGMEEPPHAMRLGNDENDYYKLTTPPPTVGRGSTTRRGPKELRVVPEEGGRMTPLAGVDIVLVRGVGSAGICRAIFGPIAVIAASA